MDPGGDEQGGPRFHPMDYGDWNMRGRIGTRGQKRQEKKASAVQTEAP
jgi:hypothetical protein